MEFDSQEYNDLVIRYLWRLIGWKITGLGALILLGLGIYRYLGR